MPNVLLVEDDGFKSDDIHALLDTMGVPPAMRYAKSVSEAIAAIKERPFDLIVLDMALPSHTATPGAGAPLSLLTGGLEVLFELQSLARGDPCVVVTQYPEIEICGIFYPVALAAAAIETQYDIRIAGCVEYSDSSTQWRATLKAIYNKLCIS